VFSTSGLQNLFQVLHVPGFLKARPPLAAQRGEGGGSQRAIKQAQPLQMHLLAEGLRVLERPWTGCAGRREAGQLGQTKLPALACLDKIGLDMDTGIAFKIFMNRTKKPCP
jgi:hypothetical protein